MDSQREKKGWNNTKSYIFPHIVENNINEFQLESVFPFTPGTAMVFDACQVHASCQLPGSNSHWMKNGMNIQFYKSAR